MTEGTLPEDLLKEVRKMFVASAKNRLAEMRSVLERLTPSSLEPTALRELQAHFHSLAGTGGTYGFPKLTTLSRIGERECQAIIEEQSFPGAEELARWRSFLQMMHEDLSQDGKPFESLPEATAASTEPPPEILIVDDDLNISYPLARLLRHEGLSVRSVSSKQEAWQAIRAQMPDGLIVDVCLPDGSGYALVEELRNLPDVTQPVVLMISALTRLADKVEAIRCGADMYFEKPMDLDTLSRRLRHLLASTRKAPARILSVEDDPQQVAYLRLILEGAGYQVQACSEPKNFHDDLIAFQPDLILMDVHLPEMNGYDLVRYLRQDERYVALPVLFLTARKQGQSRIEAVKAGGDDHLDKPVAPELLLSAVAARIERARLLKSLLDHDGLTQLLTHTAFWERVHAIVAEKERRPERKSALVMIDLDHFKAVNDQYGHPVGDCVLRALAALLRRRLRQSDVIGRYGGEEFAVVVSELQEQEAVKLVSRLLAEFASVEHQALDGSAFRVTFSAGIAMLDHAMHLEDWRQAADQALYEAKAVGRKCVRTWRPAQAACSA